MCDVRLIGTVGLDDLASGIVRAHTEQTDTDPYMYAVQARVVTD